MRVTFHTQTSAATRWLIRIKSYELKTEVLLMLTLSEAQNCYLAIDQCFFFILITSTFRMVGIVKDKNGDNSVGNGLKHTNRRALNKAKSC